MIPVARLALVALAAGASLTLAAPSGASGTVEVTIDATDLDASNLHVDHGAALPNDRAHTLTLAPGPHTLCAPTHWDCVGFEVTAEGTVGYDPSLDAFLHGRGGRNLTLTGVDLTIDATALDAVHYNVNSTLVGGGSLPNVVRTLSVLPGGYTLCAPSNWDCLELRVTGAGVLDYDAALDRFVHGRGGTTLTLTGAAIAIDATALDAVHYNLNYTSIGGRAYDNVARTLALLPGAYTMCAPSNWDCFEFRVTAAGVLDYEPVLDGFLRGRGTTALVVGGAAITIDATAVSAAHWNLNYTSVGGAIYPNAVRTLALVPGGYTLCVPSNWDCLEFQVTPAGTVDYDPSLDRVVRGRGTATLTVTGAEIVLDATALSANHLNLNYSSISGQNLANAVHRLALVPGTYTLCAPSNWACVAFEVTRAGTVAYDPGLDAYLHGRGTTRLTVTGAAITIDATGTGASTINVTYGAIGGGADANQARTYALLPSDAYVVCAPASTTCVGFRVTAAGTVDYDPVFDDTVHGRGTTRLTWGNPLVGGCAVPTLAQCLDPDFRASSCGASHEAVCAPMLAAHAEADQATSTAPLEPVIRPADGRLVDARVAHFDMGLVGKKDGPASAGFLSQRTVLGLEAIGARTDTGQLVATQYRAAPFPVPRLGSCADYVHKKWYGYQVFERAALACQNDPDCVYEVATAPGTSLAEPLRRLDDARSLMDRQIDELDARYASADPLDTHVVIPKNAFFELDWRPLLRHAAQWHRSECDWTGVCDPQATIDKQDLIALDAALDPGAIDLVVAYAYTAPDLFGWHQARHDEHAALGVTFDEYQAMAERQRHFRALTVEYGRLRTELARAGVRVDANGAFSLDPQVVLWSDYTDEQRTTLMASYNLTVNQIAGALLAEWRHTSPHDGQVDHGCLAGSRCDWSPTLFARTYLDLWQGERAQDMERCNRLTGGDFDLVPDQALAPRILADGSLHPLQSLPADRSDWSAFEHWMRHRHRALTQKASELPFRPASSAGGAQDVYKTLRWAIDPIDHEYGVRHLLYAKYEQRAVVELGASAVGDQVCSMNAGAYGKLYAEMAWPSQGGWPESHVFVDALIKVGVGRDRMEHEHDSVRDGSPTTPLDFEGHLYVDGQEIFKSQLRVEEGDVHRTAPQRVGRFYKDKLKPFSILGIPAYAQIIVEGQPSYDAEFRVNPRRTGGACGGRAELVQDVVSPVAVTLTGHLDINAIARLGVGIPGASVGIKGHLDVLDAHLPVTAQLGVIAEGTEIKLRFETAAHLTGRLLAGTISFFAELLVWKDEAVIYRWDGLPIDAKLWGPYHVDVPLADMAVLFPRAP